MMNMGYTLIAPVGDNSEALFAGMKQFPTERTLLIANSKYLAEAKKLSQQLEQFTIEAKIINIKDNVLEEMFRVFGDISKIYDNDCIVVNVATGDRISTCAALSASYANGFKAFGVVDKKPMMMPIMKLSYYTELSDNKLEVLRNLKSDEYIVLKDLAKKLNISISLMHYHINGNFKHKGLKEYRLVEVKEKSKNLNLKLTEMGSLLLKGYLPKKRK